MIASKTGDTKEELEQQIVFLKKQHERDQQHLQELGEEQEKRDQEYEDLVKSRDKLAKSRDELLEDRRKQVDEIDQKNKKIKDLENLNEMLQNSFCKFAKSYAATAPALNKIRRKQVMGHRNHHKFVPPPPQQIQPEKSPADEWVGQKMRFHPNGSIYQVESAHYRSDDDSGGFTMAEETMRVGEEEEEGSDGGDGGQEDDQEEDGRDWAEVERALRAPLLDDDAGEGEEEDDGVFEEAEGEGEVAVAAAPAPEGEGNDGDGSDKEEDTNLGEDEREEEAENEEEQIVNPIPSNNRGGGQYRFWFKLLLIALLLFGTVIVPNALCLAGYELVPDTDDTDGHHRCSPSIYFPWVDIEFVEMIPSE